MENQNSQSVNLEEYWKKFYNKVERVISWLILTLGAVILITYGIFKLFEGLIIDQEISIIVKVGIFCLIAGFVMLLISVVREKLILKKVDRYKEVEK